MTRLCHSSSALSHNKHQLSPYPPLHTRLRRADDHQRIDDHRHPDTTNPRGVTNALPDTWEKRGYLMKGDRVDERWRGVVNHQNSHPLDEKKTGQVRVGLAHRGFRISPIPSLRYTRHPWDDLTKFKVEVAVPERGIQIVFLRLRPHSRYRTSIQGLYKVILTALQRRPCL
ncbi:hypothetical protein EVAR_22439_1 [Eumeta japonica]|uniref:Uncharacterized protein n=1 Tax=Eumeta variegata TaxID=151549 RepID=A0A4C1ZVJ3_EUMVA|nr:hypothetical protein EVAR_22439_1 [Eumeta japonica]